MVFFLITADLQLLHGLLLLAWNLGRYQEALYKDHVPGELHPATIRVTCFLQWRGSCLCSDTRRNVKAQGTHCTDSAETWEKVQSTSSGETIISVHVAHQPTEALTKQNTDCALQCTPERAKYAPASPVSLYKSVGSALGVRSETSLTEQRTLQLC